MLGRFLEFSVATPDIRASLEFYAKLGFSHVEVGEAWSHPYAVVTDGRICLGLHAESASPSTPSLPSVTFVRPELLKHVAHLERQAPGFEFRRLGNDVFNEVGWRDPSGHAIRLVEARTFSPGKRTSSEPSLCGYFMEIALPTADLETAKAYWESFGFVGMDESAATLPHVSCTSDTIDIGLYERSLVPLPTLLFEVDDFEATLASLNEREIAHNGRLPAPLRQKSAAVLTAPEGTPLLLVAASGV